MYKCESGNKFTPYGTLEMSGRDKMKTIKEKSILFILLGVIVISITLYEGCCAYSKYFSKPVSNNVTIEVIKFKKTKPTEDDTYIINNIYLDDIKIQDRCIEDNLDVTYS